MSADLDTCLHSSPWVEGLISLVQRAGESILQVYQQHDEGRGGVQEKSDGSPVTQADLAAHAVLSAALPAFLPACPVVSEEDEASWVHRRARGRYWLIDPLDGTREFLQRNGEFTVNVALIVEGQVRFGLVGRPTEATAFWGGQGLGAWRRTGLAGASLPLLTPVDRFSMPGNIALRVVVSRSHLDAQTQAFMQALEQPLPGGAAADSADPDDSVGSVDSAAGDPGVRGRRVLRVQAGSSLKFCSLAAAQADLYPRLGPTHEWDTAAAQAVLEGAGGVVLDLQGQPLRYGKADPLNPSFIAAGSARWVDAELLALLRQASDHRSA
jgi:3'(2'), 5'-bisphosphate nucleotidase